MNESIDAASNFFLSIFNSSSDMSNISLNHHMGEFQDGGGNLSKYF